MNAHPLKVAFLLITAMMAWACAPARAPSPMEQQMFSEADAYERFMGRWSRLLAPALVEFAGVRDGDVVLDVGSGTGALAFAVRDRTTKSHVLGVDAAPGYVRHATKANADPRVHFELGDAQALHFDDATFDDALSLLVLNFIPDRERALAEMIRVTRPGGTVSAAVWDYGDGMEMLRVFWDEATALDPTAAPRDEVHMPLCKRGELATLWQKAGLEDVHHTSLEATLRFESFDDYWKPFLLGQGPAGAYVVSLPKQREHELATRLRARLGAGPFEMRARAWAVKGKRRSG